MPSRLDSVTIRGYKTIRELVDFQPGPLTILIGPNGAGKSNLISFFRMMAWALNPPGELQNHLRILGGASAVLHDGPERTRDIEAEFRLSTDAGRNDYCFRLAYAAGDTLIFTEEKYRFSRAGFANLAEWSNLGSGHREPALVARSERGEKTARTIHSLLRQMKVHQFHNTSYTARVRGMWSADDDWRLKEDAANLAPFLLRLQKSKPEYYHRILEAIRLILPFFGDFEIRPDLPSVLLQWRERGSDHIFSAAQAADGMLRVMALVALLQQPETDLPDVLILDEPELGLHPYGIEVIAGLIRAAAKHAQIIVATQSVALIDHFEPEDIVVVDRTDRQSTFRRQTSSELRDWLEEYTLSELWEKNVIGGRPRA